MKMLPLTQGFFTAVDDADFDRLSKQKWSARRVTQKHIYAFGRDPETGKSAYLHRVLVGVDGFVVDHIDGDTLNNQRSNLRCVSNAINIQNQRGKVRSQTGVRYVYAVNGGYYARIVRFGKHHYLGFFTDIAEAKRVVDEFIANERLEQIETREQTLRRQLLRIESELAEIVRRRVELTPFVSVDQIRGILKNGEPLP